LIDKGLKVKKESQNSKEESDASEEKKYVSTHLIELDTLFNNPEDSLTQRNIAIIVEVNQPNAQNKNQADIEEENISLIERIRTQILSVLNPSTIPSLFGSFLGTLGNILIAILSVFFIAFFFLKEHGLFGKMVSSIVSDEYVNNTLTAIDEISNLLIRYFVGIMTQVTMITAFVWIALSIIGIKNALLIAFFAALMNVIPYLGPLFGAAFAVVITISSQVDVSFYSDILPDIFKVLGVFAVMQVMDNFILQPTIFGRSVKAHPLEIFIVVLIGAKLGGIGGMVLAIPTYTVVRVIGKVFFSEFKIVQSITKSLQ
jgi:predicted PurR-regulated permease PerM